MLSQTAEHAIRAVLFLAQRAPGEPVAPDAIADALGAPRNYLAKTLNALARQGIVSSMRGPDAYFARRIPGWRPGGGVDPGPRLVTLRRSPRVGGGAGGACFRGAARPGRTPPGTPRP
jgi:hypothetical protein